MQKVNGYGQVPLHSPVDVHADQTKPFAAVCPSRLARTTLTATYIRFNGASVSDLQPVFAFCNPCNFARKFVSENARIGINGMPASQSMEIASTDPDPMHSNQGLSTGGNRTRNIDFEKFARSIQQNFSHDCLFLHLGTGRD